MSELQETEIVVDDSDFFGDEEIVILNGQRINRITGECVDTDDSISESDIHTKEDIATAFDVIMRINGFIEVTQRQLMNVGGRFEKSIRDRAERRDNLKAIYGAEIADKYGAETLDIALTDEWETPDLLSPDEIKAKQDALTKKKEDEFTIFTYMASPNPRSKHMPALRSRTITRSSKRLKPRTQSKTAFYTPNGLLAWTKIYLR